MKLRLLEIFSTQKPTCGGNSLTGLLTPILKQPPKITIKSSIAQAKTTTSKSTIAYSGLKLLVMVEKGKQKETQLSKAAFELLTGFRHNKWTFGILVDIYLGNAPSR